jgi:hypothetical protein
MPVRHVSVDIPSAAEYTERTILYQNIQALLHEQRRVKDNQPKAER